MYSEDDLLPISALQHYAFCPRQCALIHVERIWDENRLTAEGRILHERVHSQNAETEGGVRVVRGLKLRSFRLGLVGVADIVEFHCTADSSEVIKADSVSLGISRLSGKWIVVPVEYKRGKPKHDFSDEVQICAQAMCLEEMLQCRVASGFLFYGKTRHRKEVAFDAELRARTESVSRELHSFIEAQKTPPATYDNRCGACSIVEFCMPATAGAGKSVDRYITRILDDG